MAEAAAQPDTPPWPLIVLIGMKHCGKSTVGRKLARRLDAEFIDSDELLEQAHWRQTGRRQSCREIHRNFGREHFLQVEAEAIKGFLATATRGGPRVLALGGGTVLNPHLSDWLGPEATDRAGTFVYLNVPVDELWRRVRRGGVPAFVDPQDPAGSFGRIFDQRRATYERLADIVIDADGRGAGQVAGAIVEALATGRARREPGGS